MNKKELQKEFKKLGLEMSDKQVGWDNRYVVKCGSSCMYTFSNLKQGILALEEEKRRINIGFYINTQGQDIPREYI